MVAILTSDKIDLKSIVGVRDDRNIKSSRGHNNCKYACTQHCSSWKQMTDMKGETDTNTIIVEDFNILLLQWIIQPGRKLIESELHFWPKGAYIELSIQQQ